MIDRDFLSRSSIEPLDRSRHDRTGFRSGVDRIDNYLQNTAARHHAEDFSKTYVAVEPPSPEILGFYSLNPHAIEVSSLPVEVRKKMPRHPTIPAIYLATLAVKLSMQNRGLGTYLMSDFLRRCVDVADRVGGHFVVLDAIDENAARMYRRIGFVDLPDHWPRMIMNVAKVRKAVVAAIAVRAV
ncbi:MAG TPA: GNAT family N-acetyltransferase [Kaistia sp.]|nr:GNAT family N-acetyltransferase [Kaistia sp.]